MGKMAKRAAAVAATVLAVGGLSTGSPAQAGTGYTVDVSVEVMAPNASDVMDGLTVEIWPDAGDATVDTCDPDAASGDDLSGFASVPGCIVPSLGTYQIGLDGAPAGAIVTASCSTNELLERIPGTDTSFTIQQGTISVFCFIRVVQPAVLIDKVVADGDAAPGDFTLEVYGETGEPVTATDTSTDVCGPFSPIANCAVVPLPPGDYQLGELPAPGYLPSNVWCTEYFPLRPAEMFPATIGTFTLGTFDNEQSPFAWCEVTNQTYSGSLVVEKVVVNDDGGTATAADFTAEVYREAGGALVQDDTCAANGDCVAVTLPVGEYRIGETGPAGYTPSVACTVTREPDYGIGTVPPDTLVPDIQNREAITGAAALAEVEPFGEVTCVITNNDIATTTTTIAPTTTTTIAPTTSDVGGQPVTPTTLAPVLPATGPNESNTVLIVLALGLLTIGGSLLALRRR